MSTTGTGTHPIRRQQQQRRSGMDVWLQQSGKDIPVQGQIRLRLIKGPSIQRASGDPVDEKAAPESFPILAKFPVSTVTPDFATGIFRTGRLYQQDIPKPVESSDDEHDDDKNKKKKRWRYNKGPAPRQWILQQEVEFLETMMAKRQKKSQPQQQQQQQQNGARSTRYEGLPEHNASSYALFALKQRTIHSNKTHGAYDDDDDEDDPYDRASTSSSNPYVISVRCLPTPQSTIVFQQPAARPVVTLSQAEQIVQDQRAGWTTRLVLPNSNHNINESNHNNNTNGGGGSKALLLHRKKPTTTATKSRLLQKLLTKRVPGGGGEDDDKDVDEADDVMGDVAFRLRKGGGAARKELLSSLGDGLAVSQDGVLGGTNDDAFGGRQRFGKFLASSDDAMLAKRRGADGNAERGADGAAMEDDFYMRDVHAEYEELDYDANELFDDDDVDVGEKEVMNEGENLEGEDNEEDDDIETLEEEEEVSGIEGLATVAGFKKLLAKARGEIVPEVDLSSKKRSLSAGSDSKKEGEPDHRTKFTNRIMQERKGPGAPATTTTTAPPPTATTSSSSAMEPAIQTDENGLRIITLDSVRREIWLSLGTIESSRLIKIFSAKKKYGAERSARFKEIVKELCTMVRDPVKGNVLVLKPHYSHMD
jgi:hypothetical protein